MRLILISLLLTSIATAKEFTNQYSSFQLPTGWECELEGSEWVCQSSNQDRRKEAIIILAAKIRGEQDDLAQYQAYLKQAKTYTLPGGKKQVSEAKYTKPKEINGQRWVDSLHLASEVPGFYTRYLATVKEDLGVAVTLSVSKQHYELYRPVFEKLIASLRVFRQKKMDLTRVKKDSSNIIDDVGYIPEGMDEVDMSARKKKSGAGSAGGDDMTMYLIIGAAIAGFLIMKKKGGKKGKKKAKKKVKKKKS
jgi:hypothetical protein